MGNHPVKKLVKRELDVVVYDNLGKKHREVVFKGKFVLGDLVDLDTLNIAPFLKKRINI